MNNKKEETRLAPCPFCGKDGSLLELYYDIEDGANCGNPLCEIGGHVMPIKQWNSRPGNGLEQALEAQIVEYESRGQVLYAGLGAPSSIRLIYDLLGKEKPADLPPIEDRREKAIIEALEANQIVFGAMLKVFGHQFSKGTFEELSRTLKENATALAAHKERKV